MLSFIIHLPVSGQNMKNKKIVWQSSIFHTTEMLSINSAKTYLVHSNITGEANGVSFHVEYLLQINNKWEIRSVLIKFDGNTSFTLFFERDKKGIWHNRNEGRPLHLDNCSDIDISLTPFTNTLPINRLRLKAEESEEITVIYFNLPKPEFKPVRQRYTNLGNNFYKYENLESGFTSVLETDKDGIVINYPGIWHQVYPENGLTGSKNLNDSPIN